jgi:plasmid maintenance system antidote protein VapI
MKPKELRAFMDERKWDVKGLAARIPCTPVYVWLILQGKRTMSKAMEMRIRSLPKRAKPVG